MTADLLPYDVAYGATGALCLTLAVSRLVRILRHPSDYLAKTVCLAFFFTAGAFLFAVPALYLAFDDLIGVTNGATLAVYVCILLTSGAFLTLLAAWTGRARSRVVGWAAGYGVVILAMVVLFVLGSPDDGEHPIDFDAHYAADPVLSRFLLLYYAGFAVATSGVAWMSRHYSVMAAPARPWLARGLRWTSWGALLAVLYCALKVIAVAGIMAGAATQDLSTVWAPLSATLGALLMAAGLSLPGWGPAVGDAAGQVLAYRRLHPLWRLLTDAVPSVVLEPSSRRTPWAERWALRDTNHRLYRRAVEIHDARLALGPWLDPDAVDGGDVARRAGAAREAAMLARAVRAKAQGEPALHQRYSPGQPGGEWADQLGWLLAVARELRDLPGAAVTEGRATAGRRPS